VIFPNPTPGRSILARFRAWRTPTRESGPDATKRGIQHHERMIRALRAASNEAGHDNKID
jgi:hypothetical protein